MACAQRDLGMSITMKSRTPKSRLRSLALIVSGALVTALAVVAVPAIVAANADSISQTFSYSDDVQQFTVPDGITELTVTLLGGEGGEGGWDATGPLDSGYRGAVTGTLAVVPGEVLDIGVGQGGTAGANTLGSAPGGPGGTNPILGYQGGTGGVAGPEGDSGGGGGGGAATVIQVGDQTIVAGGGGGGGGSGQFGPTAGRPGASSFTPADDSTTGVGEDGISTVTVCTANILCDGGASGAGGGGAIGGAPGQVAYGAGQSTEYFGYGGSPGANDATGLTSGSSVYEYYPFDGLDGSVTITYDMSAPAAPTGVSGTAADGSADVTWLAPLSTGGSTITGYAIQYAVVSDDPSWQDFAGDASASTSTTVTGLTDGTSYEFRVAAINSFGSSDYSDASSGVTPSAAPDAPTLTNVATSDGTITASFTAVTAISPVTGYQYQLDGGSWVAAGTTSPITIGALSNGSSYSVVVRAVNAIGTGLPSNALSGTPRATPSAPTITGVSTAIGSATVSFSAGYAGGSPITDYDYQLDSGAWTSIESTSSPFTIPGLDNATSYSVRIRAESLAGQGAISSPSSFATPAAPDAPSIDGIAVGDGTLSVSFSEGGNGGLAISGLEYQLVSGGVWTAAPSLASPLALGGLSNGTDYRISLRADNALGAGAVSAPVTATPISTPGAPALLAGSVAGGDQELDATFTPPASDGGAPITGYEYSTDGGVTWLARATGTTQSPLVITTLSSDGVTPLVNGTTYSVEVSAVNSAGAGTSSGVAEGIARTIPNAPTLTSVASRPSALQVHFVSPSNGGSPITSYQYRLATGAWTSTGTLSQSFRISSLTNGTAYDVQVRAVNAVGAGDPSASIGGVPASQPGQPVITSITPGDGSLSVGATLASDGGSALTSWQYSTDGGATWAAASGLGGPFTIATQSANSAALVNGTSYSIALRALNAVGTGTVSSAMLGIPMTAPSAPTITVTPADSALSISYAVGDSGGSSITGVEYSVGGGWISAGSLQTPFVVAGLVNGTAYDVQVRLTNAVGAGAASAITSSTPRTVPDAPTSVTASSDDSQATVAWLAPADGGSPITGYTATAWSTSAGTDPIGTCTATSLTCVITGLTNGVVYYVSVGATNIAGTGAASAPRVAVLPLAKPSAPTIDVINPADTFLSLDFTPGYEGSSPISGYQYSLNGGDWVSTAVMSSPFVISGLTNGTTYAVQLRAVNQSGAGASSDTVYGTPFGEPDVPDASLITALPGSNSALVSWAAPNDNGSPITGYNVVAWSDSFQGSQLDSCSTTGELSCTLWNVGDGETYYVTVDATNAAGTTTRSTPRVAVTPGAPDAVTGLTGVAADGEVDLSWTPGPEDDAPIDGYVAWYAPVGSSDYTQFGDGLIDGTSVSVTGLSNGTAYTFEVYPFNDWGLGQVAVSPAYTPTASGVVPTFGPAVPTADGFTAEISDWDIATDYTATVDNGSVTISGSTLTVKDLTPGESATVTVTATLFGSTTERGTVDSSALLAGAPILFGAPTRTLSGYSVDIVHLLAGVTYTPSVSVGGVSFDGRTVTVSGLLPGESSDLTVTASDPGYTDAVGLLTSSALGTGTAPILSTPVSTNDGFVVTVLNPDLTGSYTASSDFGIATADGTTITVTGLLAGQQATVAVSALHVGFTNARGTAVGTALRAGADLTTSPSTQTPDGYSFFLVNYDPSFHYVVSTTEGSVAFVDGTVTVTGLVPGQSATVSMTATQTGARDAAASVAGSPMIAPGTVPILTTPISAAKGFATSIANYSIHSAYTVTTDVGQVAQVGAVLTVTGLSPGQSASVTVSAAVVGYTTESTTVLGAALVTAKPAVATVAPATPAAVTAVAAPVADVPASESAQVPPKTEPATSGGRPATKHTVVRRTGPGNGTLVAWIVVASALLVLVAAASLLLAWRRRRRTRSNDLEA
jgi:hypothetical protein